MMLYKNTKAVVQSPDRDTDLFVALVEVLQGDTLALFLSILLLDFVLQISVDPLNEIGFTLEKVRRRRYPVKKIADVDYADDLA